MKTRKEILIEICEFYRRQLYKLKSNKVNHMEGHLLIDRSRGFDRYYRKFIDKESKKKIKQYIPRKNIRTIKLLAQKTYDKKIFKLISKRLKLMEAACDGFDDDEIESVFLNLSLSRQGLVTPIITPWDKLVSDWLERSAGQEKLTFKKPGTLISKNGESVRSKTEKILADMFFDQKIAYKYEAPLRLGNNVIYPDFTFLSPYTRKEIYWEHNGMMGDELYADRFVDKISLYYKNNISQGQNLILTFESKNSAFDFALAQFFIDSYLKKPDPTEINDGRARFTYPKRPEIQIEQELL